MKQSVEALLMHSPSLQLRPPLSVPRLHLCSLCREICSMDVGDFQLRSTFSNKPNEVLATGTLGLHGLCLMSARMLTHLHSSTVVVSTHSSTINGSGTIMAYYTVP